MHETDLQQEVAFTQGCQADGDLERWDGVGGRRETQEGGDICTPLADSRWCMAEAKALESNYPPTKSK